MFPFSMLSFTALHFESLEFQA